MKRIKAILIMILILFCISSVNALALNRVEIVNDNQKIEANKKLEYSIKTEGGELVQLQFKLYDRRNKLVVTGFEHGSPPIISGDTMDISMSIPRDGIYEMRVYMNLLGKKEIMAQDQITIECGNVKKEKLTTKKGDKVAYLTFDDGPSKLTYDVLHILDRYEIKGTFFVLGKNVENNKDILEAIHNDGHAVGNHTYSHNYDFIYANTENFIDEIHKTEEIIRTVIPDYNGKMIRFPGGSFKRKEHKEAVTAAGYKHYNWHVDSGDSRAGTVEVEKIKENVYSYLWYDKIVILFHDTPAKTTTPESLPDIIEYLHEKGYRFEMLTEESMDSF